MPDFHLYLGLVSGLCQYEHRDEELLQLMVEQLEERRTVLHETICASPMNPVMHRPP